MSVLSDVCGGRFDAWFHVPFHVLCVRADIFRVPATLLSPSSLSSENGLRGEKGRGWGDSEK